MFAVFRVLFFTLLLTDRIGLFVTQDVAEINEAEDSTLSSEPFSTSETEDSTIGITTSEWPSSPSESTAESNSPEKTSQDSTSALTTTARTTSTSATTTDPSTSSTMFSTSDNTILSSVSSSEISSEATTSEIGESTIETTISQLPNSSSESTAESSSLETTITDSTPASTNPTETSSTTATNFTTEELSSESSSTSAIVSSSTTETSMESTWSSTPIDSSTSTTSSSTTDTIVGSTSSSTPTDSSTSSTTASNSTTDTTVGSTSSSTPTDSSTSTTSSSTTDTTVGSSTVSSSSTTTTPGDPCRLCSLDAECINNGSTYTCVCYGGYEGNGTVCTDIDECKDPSNCGLPTQTCQNYEGGFECRCKEGYEGNGDVCEDINECERNQDLCSKFGEVCINLEGNFECQCDNGYVSQPDGTCTDFDECANDHQLCTELGQYCANVNGTYECLCITGFRPSELGCTDIDECATEAVCTAEGEDCVNSIGSYVCRCKEPEYILENDVCKATPCKNNPCKNGGICQASNTASFECECSYPYTGDTCTCRSDVCDSTNPKNCGSGPNVKCDPQCLSAVCSCDSPGLRYNALNKTCEVFNLCLDDPNLCSGDGQQCLWDSGRYSCVCKSNYNETSSDPLVCQDFDECSTTNRCDPKRSTCVNLPGSYKCDCKDGYRHRLNTATDRCEDINECDNPDDCGCEQMCSNRDGSFACNCYNGFVLNTDGKSCRAGGSLSDCSADCGTGICKLNEEFQPRCYCPFGSMENSTQLPQKCKARNECTTDVCEDPNSICDELDAGYRCNCKDGYEKDKNTRKCVDINECEQNPCGIGFKCVNLVPGHVCDCPAETSEIIDGECKTIDFCKNRGGSTYCDRRNGDCINLENAFRCVCKPPYVKEGEYCRFNEEANTYLASLDVLIDWQPELDDPTSTQFEIVLRTITDSINSATNLEWRVMDLIPASRSVFTRSPYYYPPARNPKNIERVKAELAVLSNEPVSEEIIPQITASCMGIEGSDTCYLKNGLQMFQESVSLIPETDGCKTLGSEACFQPLECVPDARPGAYFCKCSAGYESQSTYENIEVCKDVDECQSSPCTYGVCTNTLGGYSCACEEPKYLNVNGTDCVLWCDFNSCQNGGICDNETRQCICPDPYFGMFCNVQNLVSELEDAQLSMNILGGVLGGLLGLLVIIVVFLSLRLRDSVGGLRFRSRHGDSFVEVPPEHAQKTDKVVRGLSMKASTPSRVAETSTRVAEVSTIKKGQKKSSAPAPPPMEQASSKSLNPLASKQSSSMKNPLYQDDISSNPSSRSSNASSHQA